MRRIQKRRGQHEVLGARGGVLAFVMATTDGKGGYCRELDRSGLAVSSKGIEKESNDLAIPKIENSGQNLNGLKVGLEGRGCG